MTFALLLVLLVDAAQIRAQQPSTTHTPGRWSRPAVTLTSALPIRRGPITFVAPNAACPAWKGKPVRLGTIVDPPLLDYVEPAGPSIEVTGTVILEVVISSDGNVRAAKPLRGVAGLTDAAIDAVRKWRFARTCVAGQPTPIIKAIALRFTR